MAYTYEGNKLYYQPEKQEVDVGLLEEQKAALVKEKARVLQDYENAGLALDKEIAGIDAALDVYEANKPKK